MIFNENLKNKKIKNIKHIKKQRKIHDRKRLGFSFKKGI